MHAVETYVIRIVAIDSIDTGALRVADDGGDATTATLPGRDDIQAALRFDTPIAAAEVLVGPPGANGRYPLVAGRDGIDNARAHGREVVVAAIARSRDAVPRAIRRWRVYHDAA